MGRAKKTCSWRDPEAPSIGCSRIAEESPNGENFRCREHWRKAWAGRSQNNRSVRPLTEDEKEYIRQRDWHVCRQCGEPAKQVDHIIEVADGGTNDPSNLQLLCDSCHGTKTRMSQAAFDDGMPKSARAALKKRRRMMGFYEQ